MPLNADKPTLWKADVACSIDFYNDWFLRFAPVTYRKQRIIRTKEVLRAFKTTGGLCDISPQLLAANPEILPILRMATAPPIARDRLIGLAHLKKSLVEAMEGNDDRMPRLPCRMNQSELDAALQRICDVIIELSDRDLLPWLDTKETPTQAALDRAATVIADRVCGAASDPIIRNAQEQRQLAALGKWLRKNGYRQISTEEARDPHKMPPATFAFRLNLPAGKETASVNIPIDCVVKGRHAGPNELPILIEAKSAGDATNTNKRRKEEAQKFAQLKERYGAETVFILLLCGYFEPGYLGYEASEGIDWIWEHRLDDLSGLLLPEKKNSIVSDAQEEYHSSLSSPREAARFSLQKEADLSKSQMDRNRLGQFSTPFLLARKMVTAAYSALGIDAEVSFLEPALGSGVFFSALKHELPPDRITIATGVELDVRYADIAKKLFSHEGLSVIVEDFVTFAENRGNFSQFNLLCTNPPYVRHHHLDPELKKSLHMLIRDRLGLKTSGLTGLYVYFVLLADALLAENAVASWLLPSEFLYVNYGQPLREYLSSHVTLLGIHHFDADDVQFDDALVSSCIVTYRKKKPHGHAFFSFSSGTDLATPSKVQSISVNECRESGKWTLLNFTNGETREEPDFRLGDLFDIRRGIATGANNFFILNDEAILRHSIPQRFLKPILPSPRHLVSSIIQANPDGTAQVEPRLFLLNCTLPPASMQNVAPELWGYLEEGMKQGIHKRYLCAGKDIWYMQENRTPSLFLASYMGRCGKTDKSPIRFFLNHSQAIATNVFVHMYPKPHVQKLLNEDGRRADELLNLLNDIPVEDILRAGRAYGGGLHKVEPGELKTIPIFNAPEWLSVTSEKQLALV